MQKVVHNKTAYLGKLENLCGKGYCRRQYCLKFGLLRIQQNVLSESCIQNFIEFQKLFLKFLKLKKIFHYFKQQRSTEFGLFFFVAISIYVSIAFLINKCGHFCKCTYKLLVLQEILKAFAHWKNCKFSSQEDKKNKAIQQHSQK